MGIPYIQIGTPGISSPGMESFLPAKGDRLKQAVINSSPEIRDVDTKHCGWTELMLTPDQVSLQWHFVDAILSSTYSVMSTEPLICKAGGRVFS